MTAKVDMTASELLSQMIAETSQQMIDSSLEADRVVGEAIEKGLRSAVRKISASFDEQIERIRSKLI